MSKLALLACLATLATMVSSKSLLDHKDIIKNTDKPRLPLILVPGLEASQLEAFVDKKSTVHWFCSKKSEDWFNIWLDPKELFPQIIDCFIDNFQMSYNKSTRTVQNAEGVKVRPIKFGTTEGIEFLTKDIQFGLTGYFHVLVEHFVSLGYERGVNIRGAPYDFRKSPPHNPEFQEQFKGLIEETYGTNENTPSLLICHSMGCLYSLYFLQRQDQAWKDKYIKGLIAMGAPWGGSVMATRALVTGTNMRIFIYDNAKMRGMERSFSSTYFLLPSKEGFTEKNSFMTYDGINYGIDDYERLFKLINITSGHELFEDSFDKINGLEHPGVDVTCLHGEAVETLSRLNYKIKEDFPDKPELINESGDGTVNEASLRACLKWQSHNSFNFEHKTFEGVKHIDTPKNDAVVEHTTQVVAKYMMRG